MTDEELIARLRWKAGAYAKEAADRIEQLVATNEVLVKERDQWIEHTKNAVWADSEELKLANARAERLEALLKAWIELAANCSIEEGVCCCGDNMEGHSSPWNCGHSPVDHGAYVARRLAEDTAAALKGADHDG